MQHQMMQPVFMDVHITLSGPSLSPTSVCQVGLPFLKLELASISIPDISDSYSIAVVGKIDYKLYKLVLNYFI